jgi:1,4-alpha-glucan branching enzyme
VSVLGDFNGWDGRKDQMEMLVDSGVWVLFKPGVVEYAAYKFEIKAQDGRLLEKADPYANYAELRRRRPRWSTPGRLSVE